MSGRLSHFAARAADLRRERHIGRLVSRGLRLPPPGAFASFGAGSVIVPPGRATCPELISIGDDVEILEHGWLSVVRAVPGVEPRLTIGDGARIGRFCHIACVGEVTIGRRVLTSERLFIGDTYHDFADPTVPVRDQPMASPKPVHIGDGAFLGIGVSVLRGVTIGANAYVGAGSVVTSDVEAHTVVVGNPARPVRRWNDATATWEAVDDSATAAERIGSHLAP